MTSTSGFGCFEDDLPGQRQAAETLLEKFCAAYSVKPDKRLKQKVLARLNFAGETLQLNNLPPTDRYANYLSWQEVIRPLIPKDPIATIFLKEIRRDERIVQTLVISKVDVPEETHAEYTESFFILDGRCACTVGNTIFELAPGDYLDIPLHVPHDVRLLSPQVTAILQYRF